LVTSFRIGAAKVTRIEESCGPGFPARVLLPGLSDEIVTRHRDWLMPTHFHAASGRLVLSVHAWLIETAGRRILVDTCSGDDKERPNLPAFHQRRSGFLTRFEATGVTPEAIDTVVITHMHVDHIGWNTRLVDGRWVPTFPKARYLFPKADLEALQARRSAADAQLFDDSVAPILDAGLADVTDGVTRVVDGLTIEPAAGHSPGHGVLTLDAGAAGRVAFCGDLAHHPIQIYEPQLSSAFCWNADMAWRTREAWLARWADDRTWVCTGHFAGEFVGRVERSGSAFRFSFGAPA
jgi:glyoxylase-like metal-dependent hydrolase (beta-lactamase superfamily II)